ncbi:MAG: hypothetical protein AB1416_05110, partial [Actinomycetota bacterium]
GLWLAPLPLLVARRAGRAFDPFDPLWLSSLVYLFAYGAVPALQLWDTPPFDTVTGYLRLSPPHYALAAVLSGLGFIAFVVGYFSPLAARAATAASRPHRRGSGRHELLWGGVLLLAGVLAIEATLVLAGAWNYSPAELLTGELRDAMLRALAGRGYLSVGFLAFTIGAVLLAMHAARRIEESGGSGRRVVAVYALTACVVGLLMGLLLGSRQLVVVTAVQLLVAYHVTHRRIPTRAVAGSFGVLAALGVVFVSLRNSGRLTLNPVEWAAYAAKTFDGFNFLTNALARVTDLEWGRTLVEDVFWTYLPRSVFTGKPTAFGIVDAQDAIVPGLSDAVGATATFPPGILAEGFVNFGIVGVVVLPFLAAVLLRTAFEWAAVGKGAAALVIFGYLLGNQTGLFRGFGQVLAAILVVAVLLAPLLLPRAIPRRGVARARWAFAALAALPLLAIPVAIDPDPALTPPVATAQPAPQSPSVRGRAIKRAVEQEAQKGRLRLLVFSASWCDDCVAQEEQIADAMGRSDLRAVRIALQDSPRAIAREASAEHPRLIAPTVHDDGHITFAKYGLTTLPTIIVMNGDRLTACVITGPVRSDGILAAVARANGSGRC